MTPDDLAKERREADFWWLRDGEEVPGKEGAVEDSMVVRTSNTSFVSSIISNFSNSQAESVSPVSSSVGLPMLDGRTSVDSIGSLGQLNRHADQLLAKCDALLHSYEGISSRQSGESHEKAYTKVDWSQDEYSHSSSEMEEDNQDQDYDPEKDKAEPVLGHEFSSRPCYTTQEIDFLLRDSRDSTQSLGVFGELSSSPVASGVRARYAYSGVHGDGNVEDVEDGNGIIYEGTKGTSKATESSNEPDKYPIMTALAMGRPLSPPPAAVVIKDAENEKGWERDGEVEVNEDERGIRGGLDKERESGVFMYMSSSSEFGRDSGMGKSTSLTRESEEAESNLQRSQGVGDGDDFDDGDGDDSEEKDEENIQGSFFRKSNDTDAEVAADADTDANGSQRKGDGRDVMPAGLPDIAVDVQVPPIALGLIRQRSLPGEDVGDLDSYDEDGPLSPKVCTIVGIEEQPEKEAEKVPLARQVSLQSPDADALDTRGEAAPEAAPASWVRAAVPVPTPTLTSTRMEAAVQSTRLGSQSREQEQKPEVSRPLTLDMVSPFMYDALVASLWQQLQDLRASL